MTAHPPAHPGANGFSMAPGSDGVAVGAGRPGSAPKMRTHTPNADTTASSTNASNSGGGNTNNNMSLVLRSQPSNQSTTNGGGTTAGLNSSMSLSKQIDGGTVQPHQQTATTSTSSKNMLNSFRNGPIK